MKAAQPSYRNAVRHPGFSLVEMAIVLLVIMLLSAGAVAALRVQTQRASFQKTQEALSEARDALLGFAIANGRLPCPADPAGLTAPEGTSPVACATVATVRGLIPWRTLGIQGLDAWDQRLTYQVAPEFTALAMGTTTAFHSTDPNAAAITTPKIVQTVTTAPPPVAVTDGTVAFAIWSHGPNGHLAFNISGTQQPAGALAAPDEAMNTPTFAVNIPFIVNRAGSEAGSALGEFDDISLWTSKFSFFKQLIDAGYTVPQ